MNWVKRWIERKQVKDLKLKIEKMKRDAEAARADKLMLSAETITHRIELLERAVEKLEVQRTDDGYPPA